MADEQPITPERALLVMKAAGLDLAHPPARSNGDGTDGWDEHGDAAVRRGRTGAIYSNDRNPSARRTAVLEQGYE